MNQFKRRWACAALTAALFGTSVRAEDEIILPAPRCFRTPSGHRASAVALPADLPVPPDVKPVDIPDVPVLPAGARRPGSPATRTAGRSARHQLHSAAHAARRTAGGSRRVLRGRRAHVFEAVPLEQHGFHGHDPTGSARSPCVPNRVCDRPESTSGWRQRLPDLGGLDQLVRLGRPGRLLQFQPKLERRLDHQSGGPDRTTLITVPGVIPFIPVLPASGADRVLAGAGIGSDRMLVGSNLDIRSTDLELTYQWTGEVCLLRVSGGARSDVAPARLLRHPAQLRRWHQSELQKLDFQQQFTGAARPSACSPDTLAPLSAYGSLRGSILAGQVEQHAAYFQDISDPNLAAFVGSQQTPRGSTIAPTMC